MTLKDIIYFDRNTYKCIFDITNTPNAEYYMLHLGKTFHQMNVGYLGSIHFTTDRRECWLFVTITNVENEASRIDSAKKIILRALMTSEELCLKDGFVNDQTRPLGPLHVLSIAHMFRSIYPQYSEEGLAYEEDCFRKTAPAKLAELLQRDGFIHYEKAGNIIKATILARKREESCDNPPTDQEAEKGE